MDLTHKLNSYFNKVAKKSKNQAVTQALVYSASKGVNYHFANSSSAVNQPFHVASIGKLVTATLVIMLAEQGKISLDDKLVTHLGSQVLQNLFVYNGVDYTNDITVRQLLMHTSGAADYFESSVTAGSSFVDVLLSKPDVMWTPQMLLDFTRNNQTALSVPGEYHYSDTGYVLLGLLIEKLTNMPLADAQRRYIFTPCGMTDTYLMFGGTPMQQKRTIAPIWFNSVEISQLNMLSCDWAGGGIVSTLDDLQKFQTALWAGKLISQQSLLQMQQFINKFRAGMYYGMGMMQLKFSDFFFMLRGLMQPNGHTGILGTHMYYDPATDTHIIVNFGSNKRMVDSVKALIFIAQLLKKYYKQAPANV